MRIIDTKIFAERKEAYIAKKLHDGIVLFSHHETRIILINALIQHTDFLHANDVLYIVA